MRCHLSVYWNGRTDAFTARICHMGTDTPGSTFSMSGAMEPATHHNQNKFMRFFDDRFVVIWLMMCANPTQNEQPSSRDRQKRIFCSKRSAETSIYARWKWINDDGRRCAAIKSVDNAQQTTNKKLEESRFQMHRCIRRRIMNFKIVSGANAHGCRGRGHCVD